MKDSFSAYHPFLNLFYFAVVIGLGMFLVHPVYVAISFVCACCYNAMLLGFQKGVMERLRLLLPLMLLVTAINGLFNHYGVTTFFYVKGTNAVTLEALTFGLVMAIMMASMLMWFSCCTCVMTTDKFLYLFGKVFPAISMILSMCLRFVPEFSRQAKKITAARTGIGKGTQGEGFFVRCKRTIEIFSILITWGMENGVDTADSMGARGYGFIGRTSFSLFRFETRDKTLAACMGIMSLMLFAGILKGYSYASYNPEIVLEGGASPTACILYVLYGVFCLIPVFLELSERYKWKKIKENMDVSTQEGVRLWES